MPAIPDPIHQTVAAIFAAYERDADDGNRPHLGASIIGHECERFLWLTFRWVDVEKKPGRVLRLLETGQHQEARMIADLRRIGVNITDRQADGRQWRVSAHGGHFGGSMDAAGVGFPEAPRTWHVVEFKTSNAKLFKELQRDGVRKAKPMHFAQMQVYMALTGMDRAAYLVVNKDTDDLHFERVEHDPTFSTGILGRASRVIFSSEPPLRLSSDPSWFRCKFCPFHAHCHGTAAPVPTCRSCAHATPERDGDSRWSCAKHGRDLPVDAQRAGCADHRVIPVLLQAWAEMSDVAGDDVVLYRNKLTGAEFANGPHPHGYTSAELHACGDKRAIGAQATDELRREFDGRVVA